MCNAMAKNMNINYSLFYSFWCFGFSVMVEFILSYEKLYLSLIEYEQKATIAM